MNCKQVERSLAEDQTDAREVQRHLQECDHCRALSEELELIEKLSQGLGDGKGAPDYFSNKVFLRVAEYPPQGRRSWKPVAAVGAAALFGMSLVYQGTARTNVETRLAKPAIKVLSEPIELSPAFPLVADPHQPSYVDVVLENSSHSGEPYMLRMPSVIRIERTSLDAEAAQVYKSY